MTRDRLFILRPDFEDPTYPGKRFYCWHCALMEGVLASFPNLLTKIDVERISWPKPRQTIIDLLGTNNQSVPVLILADGSPDNVAASSFQGKRFINDKDAILSALSTRHAIPVPHP